MLITKLLNVVSQTTGLQCHYGSRERLNDELDDATFPCAFVFLMQNGNIQTDGGQICESSNVGVFVVDKTDYDFETIENAEIIEQCKQRIDRLIFGLYGSDSLQLNQINNTTQIYDEFDVILTGYAVEINVTEIYGTACVGAVIPEPHPYALQDKTVTPSSIQQIITADSGYYGLGHVTVGPGQTCELQEKEIEVVENGQSEITPDEGYNGISKLTLTTNVPLPTIEPQKEIDINQNGYFTIDPSTNFDAMSKVVAHVDVPQTRVQALRAFQINKDNVSLLPVRIEPSANYDAMAEVAVDVVVNPVTVEATTQMQSVTPHEYGLAFFDGVTINPVTRYIDGNIQANNIKKDITILGVTGTLEDAISYDGYVKNGLMFYLNANDFDGTKWIDRIGGITLTNFGATKVDGGVRIDDGTYLYTNEFINAPFEICQIEVCYNQDEGQSSFILVESCFESSIGGNVGYGIYNNRIIRVVYNSAVAGGFTTATSYEGFHSASSCKPYFSIDGIVTTSFGSDDWLCENNGICLGRRYANGQYQFKGIIHSIRIYCRNLSINEVESNRQIDIELFNR